MATTPGQSNWRIGLSLSLVAMVCWGVLPLGLKLALQALDVFTLTWARFVLAGLLLGLYLWGKGLLRHWKNLTGPVIKALIVAALFLSLNYFCFVQGLALTTASNAEVLIQVAPGLLGLGSIFLFQERYTKTQWFGFGLLCTGLGLFFQDQIQTLLTHLNQYLLGSLILLTAAIVWTVYALVQKQILKTLSSTQTLVLLYAGCTLLLTPFARVTPLFSLSLWEGLAVIFCGLNTLIAYGSFGEAMVHWESSRISAVLALSPIVTLIAVDIAHALWPNHFAAEPITALGWLGAIAVVIGSWMTALGRTQGTSQP
jgi:drug/metabolite transporter (DMT)-like permease